MGVVLVPLLALVFICCRSSCVIDEGDSALLIAGSRSGCCYFKTVERFDITGLLETLPSLNMARASLGCGKYQNSDGEKVRRSLSSDQSKMTDAVWSTSILRTFPRSCSASLLMP